MQYGVLIFPTDYSISPADLARAAEERGFESMWFAEHSHIPVSRISPWPGGGELPKMYYDTLDPLVALGSAASVTSTIKLCTGICLVVQRDPIHLAKEVATIDQLSGGRMVLGVGGGWNAEEMADHGTEFKTRFKLMAERIAAMKLLWTENEAEYHGEFVDFDPTFSWPKPVQKPHPPIIVGGAFPYGAKRAIEYGDGWMPVGGRAIDLVEQMPRFRQMVAESGRDPDSFEVGLYGTRPEADYVKRLADAGVSRAIFALPSAGADEVLPLLDQFAGIAREVGG